MKGIENFDLSVLSLDCTILESENDQVRVILKSNQKEGRCAEIEVKTGSKTLSVVQKNKINLFSFGFFRETLEIYLPEITFQKLKLHLTSGDLRTIPLTCNQADVSASSGFIDLQGIKSKKYSVHASSGDIKISSLSGSGEIKLTSGSLEIGRLTGSEHSMKMTSGDMKIGAVTGEVTVKSTSGFVELGSLSGGGKIELTSGDLKVGLKSIDGDLNVSCLSGFIDINLGSDISCFVNTDVFSGDVKSNIPMLHDGRKRSGTVGDDPVHTLSVSATSGDIRINKGEVNEF